MLLLLRCGDIESNPGPQVQSEFKNIAISHINIQSLGSGEQGITSDANVKLNQLQTILCHEHKFDIVCVSETWLNDGIPDEDINIDNYVLYRKDRATRGGGVCAYVHRSLPCKRRLDLEVEAIEMMWIEITLVPKPMLVSVCYRPPGMNRQLALSFIDDFTESTTKVISTNPGSIYILGDFNDRCSTWESNHENSELKQDFLTSTTSLGLHQLINEPTFLTENSANLLDLIFTDAPGHVGDCGTLPPFGTSHHAVVYCKTRKRRKIEKPYLRTIWQFDDADIWGLTTAIENMPTNKILEDITNTSEAVEHWSNKLKATAQQYIPCRVIKVNPKDKPWITKRVKGQIKKRNRLYRRYKRTQKNEHLLVYRTVNSEVNTSIASAKEEYRIKMINKLENSKTPPRQYWNIYKQLNGSRVDRSIPTIDDNGILHSTALEKANLLAEYFASQSQEPEQQELEELKQMPQNYNLTHIQITEPEVLSVLNKLNPNKSVGHDGIGNRLLKMIARPLTPSLTKIFNACLQKEVFPNTWKKANVTPVHKQGSKADKTNYRPISLLPAISKVFERILFNILYKYCEDNMILTWRNSGYRHSDSTVNQMLHITDKIYRNLDNGEDSCLVFLDQSRAFDRIWHAGLLAKLKMYGINGSLLNFLCNYLHNRKIRVVTDGISSEWYTTTAGVPQGSILGPLLFLLYINDIVAPLQCDIHLYADDAVLMTNTSSLPNAYNVINNDLQLLQEWANKWHMLFNPTKTKYMVISNSNDVNNNQLVINNTQIEQVSSFKQLGLFLDDKMTWETHINHIVLKATKKIGLLWRVSLNFPRICAENIYTTTILPTLDYGCSVYDSLSRRLTDRLEAVQRRAAVACTRAFNRTPTTNLLSELGWPTLESRRQYFRLVQLYRMHNNHVPEYVTSLLPPTGYNERPTRYPNNYINPRSRTQKRQGSFIPRTVKDWNNLDNSTKAAQTLASFKCQMKSKLFPTKVQLYSRGRGKHAINHARMRMGLSHLRHQLYSFGIIQVAKCIQCGYKQETAMHYLLVCHKYADIRITMLNDIATYITAQGHVIDYNNKRNLSRILLDGSTEFPYHVNRVIFVHVQQYIEQTNRFQ